jgi:ABC-type multidrug transport system fused ATPase/permease subunit
MTQTDPRYQPSIGELVSNATRDISTLVQNEIALAKEELRISVRFGGTAVALFLLAGFLVLLAVIFLFFGVVYLITMTGLGLAWSFLIVVGGLLIVAGISGFVGFRLTKKVQIPEKSIDQAKKTKDLFSR